jgi:two-component sensor histidine kinase
MDSSDRKRTMASRHMASRHMASRHMASRHMAPRPMASRPMALMAPEGNGGHADATAKEFFPNFSTVFAVLEAAQIGIWCWDIATGKVIWSSNLEAIHRQPAGSFDGTYAGFEKDVCRDDWPHVEASLQEAVRTHGAYRVRYRLPERMDNNEECWLEASGTVARSASERMLGLCLDITERVNLEAELRSRIRQQEALAQLGERALAEPDLERLLNDAVSTVAVTLAVDFVTILELLPGKTDLLLRAALGWNADMIGAIIASTGPESYARYTLDSSLPVVTADFAAETRFRVDRYLHERGCAAGINVAIAPRDDRSYGILGVYSRTPRQFSAAETVFVTAAANLLAGAIARRQLEQRHELMIRDMRHRSGNLFSQLLALFSQTAKNSKSIPDLANKYRARVLALANAQRLITEGGGRTIPFVDLLNVLLAPYLDRVTFNGPDVELEPDPVFNLSAALQELADNAVKHGSLSRPKGRLDLSWSMHRTDRGMTLVLDWEEKNGPAARRPRRSGFGTRLIALVIERQLNGEVTRTYGRKGVSVHMVVPLTHERWPSAAAPAGDGKDIKDERPR